MDPRVPDNSSGIMERIRLRTMEYAMGNALNRTILAYERKPPSADDKVRPAAAASCLRRRCHCARSPLPDVCVFFGAVNVLCVVEMMR